MFVTDKAAWMVTELLNVVVCTTSDFFYFFPVPLYASKKKNS